ncbi:MAG TPA: hypothetical protein VF910_00925 [Candidatus Bathyarchaeia archaeon]
MRSINGRALLATVGNLYRNGTIFSIDHRDHLTPLGAGGGSPLVNQAPQLVTDPENFGAASWTVWVGTPTLTAGQADPFGGTAAYQIDDNNAASAEAIQATVAFTADGTKSIAIYLRNGTATKTSFGIYDNTAAAWRAQVDVTWTAGVPSAAIVTGGGTVFPNDVIGSGWYRILIAVNSVVAANSNRFLVYGTDTTNALTGTTFIFGTNAWNTATPAGYIGASHPQATGNSFYLDGATASVSNWLRTGDVLSVGGLAPVYEVTADTNSLTGGFVILPVNPPIFTGGAPADNAVVTITGVTLQACILEPPAFPNTSGVGADYGELVVKFSESL